MLTPLQAITSHKILLFAKNVDKWSAFYKGNPNVTVQPVGPAFQHALARSSGIIASPSPGVVIQALGCAKPCYLFIPDGHLEQTCNYNYYMKHFVGVSSPLSEPITQWADRALEPITIEAAKACLKPSLTDRIGERFSGNKQQAPPMLAQAYRIRDWLNSFEEAAHSTLIRSLRRLHGHADAPATAV